jgi:predicted NACHT family NTPase
MAARSLKATVQGLEAAHIALTGKGWSKEDLAEKVTLPGKKTTTGIGIATVKKFFAGKNVDRKYFVGICNALDVDWEDIAGLKSSTPVAEPAEPPTDIDALVHTIRQRVHADIYHRCGTMRVLDMEQPIDIGDIYTNVNILEKLSGRRRLGLDELWQDCDRENFDRFLLGQIHHERVPGLDAVERYDKLMILGKPGAGKTTFMKRLATLCNQGTFQAHRVPVFVTLKEFAEAKGEPDLETYIGQQWQTCGIKDADVLTSLLGQGRALILLDGLDEVQETEHDRVLKAIKDFTGQYRDCQCVMTCRIAAREYTFQHFTEVEVADFNEEQINEFATKWFRAKQDSKKSETFIQRLKDNKPIQELATNPLLLTLLCLVFGEAADFPANRSELYKEGLDVLLKKWDAKRNIDRDQVYKKLSLKRKEDLLSQLAFATFARGDYFFKQSVVEQHIVDYIRHLPGAHDDEDALQLDSEAVLKSIEAQHGLLVERARGIYSFSHLTFQEYFTAQQITRPAAQLLLSLADLAQHVTEKRYREIFLLTVGMLPRADDLLVLMKQKIDRFMESSPDLQLFLSWIYEKAQSVEVSYKPSAVRAFYFAFSRVCNHALRYDSNSHFKIQLLLGGISSSSPRSMKVSRCSQLSKYMYRVKARKSSKKVFRVGRCARNSLYFWSSKSSTVWKRKAKMFRVASNEAKCCWPWPKLCSRL